MKSMRRSFAELRTYCRTHCFIRAILVALIVLALIVRFTEFSVAAEEAISELAAKEVNCTGSECRTAKPSAMCVVGNIRTLPLTFDSMERFAVSNALQVYMVLQKGKRKGSTWLRYEAAYYGIAVENAVVDKLLEIAGKTADNSSMDIQAVKVVRHGTCTEYRRTFLKSQKQLEHQHCIDTPSHSQIVWTRTCFDMVLQSGISYHRIVRVRPDIAFFGAIALRNYPTGCLHAGLRREAPPVASDFFYFLDYSQLRLWWARVEDQAQQNGQQWPYPDFFIFQHTALQRHHFPAVILRSPAMAECCRFSEAPGGEGFLKVCRKALGQGDFLTPSARFDVQLDLADARELIKLGLQHDCNIDYNFPLVV
eukprot:TRINITY_DN76257_c0_g1_i1.p1 TRINITY_DN76257_c0_g1~~TRINITY_DN76257_c0_g1_i1.p1  ORF type:complete len:366 (+),score=33.40 TRINITY_DN76257_c0_g1_i1:63-1160(+)